METQTLIIPAKDPQVELAELKLAVRIFCHTLEVCAIFSTELKIQIDSDHYKKMKSKI